MGNYNILINERNFYDQPINDLDIAMKSEKYQQDKVMVILQDVYEIMQILKTVTD